MGGLNQLKYIALDSLPVPKILNSSKTVTEQYISSLFMLVCGEYSSNNIKISKEGIWDLFRLVLNSGAEFRNANISTTPNWARLNKALAVSQSSKINYYKTENTVNDLVQVTADYNNRANSIQSNLSLISRPEHHAKTSELSRIYSKNQLITSFLKKNKKFTYNKSESEHYNRTVNSLINDTSTVVRFNIPPELQLFIRNKIADSNTRDLSVIQIMLKLSKVVEIKFSPDKFYLDSRFYKSSRQGTRSFLKNTHLETSVVDPIRRKLKINSQESFNDSSSSSLSLSGNLRVKQNILSDPTMNFLNFSKTRLYDKYRVGRSLISSDIPPSVKQIILSGDNSSTSSWTLLSDISSTIPLSERNDVSIDDTDIVNNISINQTRPNHAWFSWDHLITDNIFSNNFLELKYSELLADQTDNIVNISPWSHVWANFITDDSPDLALSDSVESELDDWLDKTMFTRDGEPLKDDWEAVAESVATVFTPNLRSFNTAINNPISLLHDLNPVISSDDLVLDNNYIKNPVSSDKYQNISDSLNKLDSMVRTGSVDLSKAYDLKNESQSQWWEDRIVHMDDNITPSETALNRIDTVDSIYELGGNDEDDDDTVDDNSDEYVIDDTISSISSEVEDDSELDDEDYDDYEDEEGDDDEDTDGSDGISYGILDNSFESDSSVAMFDEDLGELGDEDDDHDEEEDDDNDEDNNVAEEEDSGDDGMDEYEELPDDDSRIEKRHSSNLRSRKRNEIDSVQLNGITGSGRNKPLPKIKSSGKKQKNIEDNPRYFSNKTLRLTAGEIDNVLIDDDDEGDIPETLSKITQYFEDSDDASDGDEDELALDSVTTLDYEDEDIDYDSDEDEGSYDPMGDYYNEDEDEDDYSSEFSLDSNYSEFDSDSEEDLDDGTGQIDSANYTEDDSELLEDDSMDYLGDVTTSIADADELFDDLDFDEIEDESGVDESSVYVSVDGELEDEETLTGTGEISTLDFPIDDYYDDDDNEGDVNTLVTDTTDFMPSPSLGTDISELGESDTLEWDSALGFQSFDALNRYLQQDSLILNEEIEDNSDAVRSLFNTKFINDNDLFSYSYSDSTTLDEDTLMWISANTSVIEGGWDPYQAIKTFSQLSTVESEPVFMSTFLTTEDWSEFPTVDYFFSILSDSSPSVLENFGNDYEDDGIFNSIVRGDSLSINSRTSTTVGDLDAMLRPVPVVNHTSNTLAGTPDEALASSDAVFGGSVSGVSVGIVRNILSSVDESSTVGVTNIGLTGSPSDVDLEDNVSIGNQNNEVQLGRDADIDDLSDKNLSLDDPSDMFQITDLINNDNIKRDAVSFWAPSITRDHRNIRGADRLYRWRYNESRDWPVQFKAYGVLSRQDNTVLRPLHWWADIDSVSTWLEWHNGQVNSLQSTSLDDEDDSEDGWDSDEDFISNDYESPEYQSNVGQASSTITDTNLESTMGFASAIASYDWRSWKKIIARLPLRRILARDKHAPSLLTGTSLVNLNIIPQTTTIYSLFGNYYSLINSIEVQTNVSNYKSRLSNDNKKTNSTVNGATIRSAFTVFNSSTDDSDSTLNLGRKSNLSDSIPTVIDPLSARNHDIVYRLLPRTILLDSTINNKVTVDPKSPDSPFCISIHDAETKYNSINTDVSRIKEYRLLRQSNSYTTIDTDILSVTYFIDQVLSKINHASPLFIKPNNTNLNNVGSSQLPDFINLSSPNSYLSELIVSFWTFKALYSSITYQMTTDQNSVNLQYLMYIDSLFTDKILDLGGILLPNSSNLSSDFLRLLHVVSMVNPRSVNSSEILSVNWNNLTSLMVNPIRHFVHQNNNKVFKLVGITVDIQNQSISVPNSLKNRIIGSNNKLSNYSNSFWLVKGGSTSNAKLVNTTQRIEVVKTVGVAAPQTNTLADNNVTISDYNSVIMYTEKNNQSRKKKNLEYESPLIVGLELSTLDPIRIYEILNNNHFENKYFKAMDINNIGNKMISWNQPNDLQVSSANTSSDSTFDKKRNWVLSNIKRTINQSLHPVALNKTSFFKNNTATYTRQQTSYYNSYRFGPYWLNNSKLMKINKNAINTFLNAKINIKHNISDLHKVIYSSIGSVNHTSHSYILCSDFYLTTENLTTSQLSGYYGCWKSSSPYWTSNNNTGFNIDDTGMLLTKKFPYILTILESNEKLVNSISFRCNNLVTKFTVDSKGGITKSDSLLPNSTMGLSKTISIVSSITNNVLNDNNKLDTSLTTNLADNVSVKNEYMAYDHAINAKAVNRKAKSLSEIVTTTSLLSDIDTLVNSSESTTLTRVRNQHINPSYQNTAELSWLPTYVNIFEQYSKYDGYWLWLNNLNIENILYSKVICHVSHVISKLYSYSIDNKKNWISTAEYHDVISKKNSDQYKTEFSIVNTDKVIVRNKFKTASYYLFCKILDNSLSSKNMIESKTFNPSYSDTSRKDILSSKSIVESNGAYGLIKYSVNNLNVAISSNSNTIEDSLQLFEGVLVKHLGSDYIRSTLYSHYGSWLPKYGVHNSKPLCSITTQTLSDAVDSGDWVTYFQSRRNSEYVSDQRIIRNYLFSRNRFVPKVSVKNYSDLVYWSSKKLQYRPSDSFLSLSNTTLSDQLFHKIWNWALRYDSAILQQYFYSYHYNNPAVPFDSLPEALFITDTYTCLRGSSNSILDGITRSGIDFTKKNELNKYIHNVIINCKSSNILKIREPNLDTYTDFSENNLTNSKEINNQSSITANIANYQLRMNTFRYSAWVNQ